MLLLHGTSQSAHIAPSGDQPPAAAPAPMALRGLTGAARWGKEMWTSARANARAVSAVFPLSSAAKGEPAAAQSLQAARLPALLQTRNKPHGAAQNLHVFGRTRTPDDQSSHRQHQTQQHPSQGWATTLRCNHSPCQDAQGCGWDGLVPTQGWGAPGSASEAPERSHPAPILPAPRLEMPPLAPGGHQGRQTPLQRG